MDTEDPMTKLHDKATRGEPLAAEEQAQLDRWYALQDKAEGSALGLGQGSAAVSTLHRQIEAALAEMLAVTKRIQELAAENEALRREVTALRLQLAHRPVSQPA